MKNSNDKLSLDLAGRICDCPNVRVAASDKKHPCHKVVNEQNKLISVTDQRQRPEPWVGNLTSSKILFISSNPSINEDLSETGEIFPTFGESVEESAKFFIERFDQSRDQPWVSFNLPGVSNFLTLCRDGDYRSGTKNPKKSQPTWNNTHSRAKELLGENAHPNSDYAITEIVHCKSKDSIGVDEASSECVDRWLKEILLLSPAKIVILLGWKVRDYFAIPILGANSDFGKNKSYSKLTPRERVTRDIFISDYSGEKKIYLFNWHPTAPAMRKLSDVYGQSALGKLKQIINGEIEMPINTGELHNFLK